MEDEDRILGVEGQEGLPSYEQSIDVAPDDEGESQVDESQEGDDGHGSTSRFNRWRSWVEKRALERYPEGEDRQARTEARRAAAPTPPPLSPVQVLHPPPTYAPPVVPNVPLPPTDLCRVDYPLDPSGVGPSDCSTPHAQGPITCCLPLLDGKLVLLGTPDGLVVVSHNVRHVWSGLGVWAIRVLSASGDAGKTPRGAVLLHVGGDGKKKGAEARVWKLESLVSLARWSATQDAAHGGIDLNPRSKGKGRPRDTGTEAGLAEAWARDFVTLPTKDVLGVSSTIGTEILVAVGTKEAIVLYAGGPTSTSAYALKGQKSFYLPSPALHMGFISLATPVANDEGDWERDEIGLGLFVSFGHKACLIRIADSTVTDLDIGQQGKVWAPVQRLTLPSGEVAVMTRGTESFVYAAPIRIPFDHAKPIVVVPWHEAPLSICARETYEPDSASPSGTVLRLTATSSGIIHTHKIDLTTTGQYRGTPVPAAVGRDARLLSNGWEALGERGADGGMFVSVKEGNKDWRVIRLEAAVKMGLGSQ